MVEVRCISCNGSGQIMGGGMIFHDCEKCEGVGKVYRIDKESKEYKDTIKDIKNINKEMSDEEAEKLFENGISNIKEKENDKIKTRKNRKSSL